MSDFKTPSNALERLERSRQSPEVTYSMEEQISSADNFIDGMGEDAISSLEKAINKPESEPVIQENAVENDVLFNNEEEPKSKSEMPPIAQIETPMVDKIVEHKKAGRPRKNTKVESKTVSEDTTASPTGFDDAFNPIMNQIAKDIIEDLKKSGYTIGNFNNSQMRIIFDYICKKF